MKIELALQVLFNGMFSTLLISSNVEGDKEFVGTKTTAFLGKNFNDMIDKLNIKSKFDPCLSRRPIYIKDFDFLQ